jgi:hypothetical protein
MLLSELPLYSELPAKNVHQKSEEEILEFYDRTQVPIKIQQISLDHFRAKLIKVLR